MKGIDRNVGQVVLFALVAMAVGCGGAADDASDTAAAGDTASQEVAATPQAGATATGQPGPVSLTEGDLDLYRRGREAEIADVREKATRLARARTGTDSVTIMMALGDEPTRQRAAAAAIGVDEARYRGVMQAVDEVLAKWQFAKMTSDMAKQTDTSTMTAEQKEQLRGMATANYDGLPPRNVELVLRQAPLLDSLRVMPAMLALAAAQGR